MSRKVGLVFVLTTCGVLKRQSRVHDIGIVQCTVDQAQRLVQGDARQSVMLR